MKKMLFSLLIGLLFCGAALGASYSKKELQIIDEWDDPVTDITSITILNAGTSTNSTLYGDALGNIVVTNPVTTSSPNTTLTQHNGHIHFYSRDADYKVTVTDGTRNLTIDDMTGSKTRFPWYANYIGSLSSFDIGDNNELNIGSDDDWVVTCSSAGILNFIPDADNSAINLGVSGTSYNTDLNVYVGAALGLKLDAGDPSLTWDGGAVLINHTSNFNVGLCTGTSTGTVTLGNSAGGNISVDTAGTATYNSDGATTITTTTAVSDIVITATLGRTTIFGGEDAADAILLEVDNNTASTLRLFNDTGTSVTEGAASIGLLSDVGGVELRSTANLANAIALTNDGGTTGTILIFNDQGTSTTEKAASVQLLSDVGSIELWSGLNGADAVNIMVDGDTASGITVFNDTGTGDESILLSSDVGGVTVNAAAGSVDIEAVGGDAGDIILNSGDDMTLTVAGDLTLAVTGSTVLPADILLKATTDITAAEVNDIADTPIELVAAVAGNVHEFVYAIMAYDYGTAAWTEPSAPDDMCIRYTDGSGAIVSALMDASTTGLTDAEDTVTFVPPVSDTVGGTTAMVGVVESGCTNKALVLHNTGTDYTGDGNGALRVIVYYRTHTTAELGL